MFGADVLPPPRSELLFDFMEDAIEQVRSMPKSTMLLARQQCSAADTTPDTHIAVIHMTAGMFTAILTYLELARKMDIRKTGKKGSQ